MVHLHYILLWHSEVLISRSFAKNKKTTVLLMRRGIQICKNLSAVLSALRTIIDWIFYKLDDRRTFWSPSSSTCQLSIAPIGIRRSKGRAKSRNTFIDNWVCDQIIRGSRMGWFKKRADFLLWDGWNPSQRCEEASKNVAGAVHSGSKLWNPRIQQIDVYLFPMISEASDCASKRMSAASSAAQTNEWAVGGNEQVGEWSCNLRVDL